MAYNHGVRVKEQATSLVAPVTGTAGLQVIIGTAPVNLAADPYKATNVPMIAYSFSEAVEQVGYSDDFKNYTLCQSVDACFRVLNVAPIILINVLDPKKHKKANEEQTVNVEKMQATVKAAGILADTVEVKANEATLTAGTDYITTFDDDGHLVITLTAGGKGASAKTLTVNSTSIDPTAVTESDIIGGYNASTGAETGMELIRHIYPKFSMTPGLLLAPGWTQKPNVGIALAANVQVKAAVAAEQLQHVIQEAAAGVHLIHAFAVQLQAQSDVGFGCFALDLCISQAPSFSRTAIRVSISCWVPMVMRR